MKSSRLSAIALGLIIAALLTGCKKNIDNNEAVKQGISSYLSKRSDLLAMEVSVQSVAYKGDEATATVRFQAKGNSSPNAGMTMQYVLERKDNQWVVKGKGGGDIHTGMPQGAPGAPGAPQGSIGAMPNTGAPGATPQQLPPGHPAIEGANPTGSLPPGHPQIPAQK